MRARLALVGLSAVLCLAMAEVGARALWQVRFGVSMRDPGKILYAFYPELRAIDRDSPARGDGFYDILLLGASTLHAGWGAVAMDLREALAYRGYRNVRVFNLAQPAQTSRDSRLGYAAAGRARFDLVAIYHGINDARTNNAPPELFRPDYGHYGWYEVVNALAPFHGASTFALPYTLRYLAIKARQKWAGDRYVPTNRPRPEWVQYGRDIRSAAPFEDNLRAILDLAAERGDPALLMTFATYVPDNYSLEAFKAKRLDYGLHLSPIETWGDREQVLKAVGVHNEIVRALAARRAGVLFVDQAAQLAGVARDFNDVCHLTSLGSSAFAANMAEALLPRLAEAAP